MKCTKREKLFKILYFSKFLFHEIFVTKLLAIFKQDVTIYKVKIIQAILGNRKI